jgi:adenosine deaminase
VLPKADLHLHQEVLPRLDRVVARRTGRPAYGWRERGVPLLARTPPGMARLSALTALDQDLDVDAAETEDPETFVLMIANILEEAAADGAVLVEVRCGPAGLASSPTALVPLLREAERRVQALYPRLRAEAIGYLRVPDDADQALAWERRLESCIEAAGLGLGGVDFTVVPYDREAPASAWERAYGWSERAARAGLGVTVHVGEFAAANCAAALRVPGLRRLGHAVHYADDPRLLADLAASGATVECCPTCNVALGAVPSLEAHPIRRLAERGIPVTLNTDLPARLGITIGHEYDAAAALGFARDELLGFTRNAVRASFAPPERRAALLEEIDAWKADASGGAARA